MWTSWCDLHRWKLVELRHPWFRNFNSWIAEDLEVVHRRFCKFALGVPNTATNLAVYGELGRVPLEIKRRGAIIKYWLQLYLTGILQLYSQKSMPCKQKVVLIGYPTLYIEQTLASLGFTNIWLNPTSVPKSPSRRTWTKIKGPIFKHGIV